MGTPHLAIPLRLDGAGAFATVEQDSDEELAQCVAACLATPVGSRVEVPDYGTPRSEFNLADPAEVVAAVTEWEPRVDLDVETVRGLGDGETVARITALLTPHL